jgi:hypothetical protein
LAAGGSPAIEPIGQHQGHVDRRALDRLSAECDESPTMGVEGLHELVETSTLGRMEPPERGRAAFYRV